MIRLIKFCLLGIFLISPLCFTSCNAGRSISFEEDAPESKENDSVKKQPEPNISKTEPNPAPKAPDPAPPPAESPKKEAPEKKPAKKQANQNNVVSSFSTKIIDYDENRIHNIRLAAKKVNSVVLNPGEVFSFNEIVGKRDSPSGYRKATVLVKGERDEDIGGGVCQLSSTIYNASSKLGLQIIERHTHSGDVHYVERGRDAAVSYGYMDLQFKNTKNYPLKFRVSVENGKVSVSILKAK